MAKTTRTIQEINQDYFQTAAMLGDLIWKVSKFTGEGLESGQIGDLKRKLRVIDNEMDERQKVKAKEDQANEELARKRKEAETKLGGVPGFTKNSNIEAPQASV